MADSAPLSSASSPAVHDHWVAHPEGRLFVRSWSPGTAQPPSDLAPILMLHDSLGCVELWRDFPARLCQATGRRVLAYDRLGFGRSDARRERPSLDFVAEEAAHYLPAVLAQLALAPVVLLGHSVGGGMALHGASLLADRCQAVVTLSAQVFAEDRTLEGIRAARAQFQDPAQAERLARYHQEKAPWVLDAWIENWLHPDFGRWTLAGPIARIAAPILVMHGENDEYGSVVHPERIQSLAAGPVSAHILPGVGHVPHREQPDRVLQAIRDFLQP